MQRCNKRVDRKIELPVAAGEGIEKRMGSIKGIARRRLKDVFVDAFFSQDAIGAFLKPKGAGYALKG